jgi:hypothetical protein
MAVAVRREDVAVRHALRWVRSRAGAVFDEPISGRSRSKSSKGLFYLPLSVSTWYLPVVLIALPGCRYYCMSHDRRRRWTFNRAAPAVGGNG